MLALFSDVGAYLQYFTVYCYFYANSVLVCIMSSISIWLPIISNNGFYLEFMCVSSAYW